MTNEDAIKILEEIVFDVTKREVKLSLNQDLQRDDIVDSLDVLVFYMELEARTGVVTPEIVNLINGNWYSVEKLCKEIIAKQG